ncbi:MAG: hypothetical protein A2340_03045 [Lentisphaerae bacterium RIFOXYB12_FULL_60_10]|nr:MAG: hypothetical protein A2340_03045 [Lentisphaerae bacterium RIFOXYB12_FULL_60_10]
MVAGRRKGTGGNRYWRLIRLSASARFSTSSTSSVSIPWSRTRWMTRSRSWMVNTSPIFRTGWPLMWVMMASAMFS